MKSLWDWMIRMIRRDGWKGIRESGTRVVGRMGVLLTPHRRHVYQLLANEMRIDHWKVSVGYGVLQAVVGLGALGLKGYGTLPLVGYLGVWFVGFCGFGMWVRRRSDVGCRMSEDGKTGVGGQESGVGKRQMSEVRGQISEG